MAKTNWGKELLFDFEFLDRLIIGIGEVSQISAVPLRQIRYWEEKGVIQSLTEEVGKNRRYDYKNVKTILMIKTLIDDGFTLDAAAEKVRKRLEQAEKPLSKLKNKLLRP